MRKRKCIKEQQSKNYIDMEYTYEFLRNCHGLRFRATICNQPQEGVIKVASECVILCYGEEDPGYLVTFGRRDTLSFSEQTFSILPKDFEIVPRDPETYCDWQVEDKMHNLTERWEIEASKEVIFRSGELVICKDNEGNIGGGYTCEQVHRLGWRLVLTDIENQIIEERKVVEDIEPERDEPVDVQKMITDALEGYVPKGSIEGFPIEVIAKMLERQYEQSGVADVSVFERNKGESAALCGFNWGRTEEGIDFWLSVIGGGDFSKFFERYPKAVAPGAGLPFSFKKFDPVLMRDYDCENWQPQVFGRYGEESDNYQFYRIDGIGFRQCIPLNDSTISLVNKRDSYNDIIL